MAVELRWQDIVEDDDERKVFMALDDPGFTWRTVGAITRQTGLPEDKVLAVVAKYSAKLVRMSRQPSASGKPLVGLITKVDE
jgi:hypothetical protein